MDATHSRHLNRTVLCAAVSSAYFNFLLLTAMVNDNARSFTVGPFVRPAFFCLVWLMELKARTMVSIALFSQPPLIRTHTHMGLRYPDTVVHFRFCFCWIAWEPD